MQLTGVHVQPRTRMPCTGATRKLAKRQGERVFITPLQLQISRMQAKHIVRMLVVSKAVARVWLLALCTKRTAGAGVAVASQCMQ